MNYILYAIPFFFLLIGIELLLEKIRGTDYYRVNDAINSLSAGILSRMTDILKKLIPLTIYTLVYQHFAYFELPDTTWVFVASFILYDLCYYWNHRLGHEMNLLWAAHVVHHNSEEYNLTTALRQTGGSFLSWVFYLPLALLGFDPLLIVSVGALNLIYQFWVHTRHVPKLGWFEWVFVSPSNHRVHHAQNAVYLDRNYGGVFIVWDRLFGSFQEELDAESPIYGVRKPLQSWNPIWANLQVYSLLARDCWYTKRWQDKIQLWFRRTGWRPADVAKRFPIELADLAQFKKYDVPLSLGHKCYALLQHVQLTLIGVMFLLSIGQLNVSEQLLLVAFVVFASVSIGGVLERKHWVFTSELSKHGLIFTAIATQPLAIWLAVGLGIVSLVSIVCLRLFIDEGQHRSNGNGQNESSSDPITEQRLDA